MRETIPSYLFNSEQQKRIVMKIHYKKQFSMHLYGGVPILMRKLVVGAENYMSLAKWYAFFIMGLLGNRICSFGDQK